MTDSDRLLNYFEGHLSEILAMLEKAVNLESPSHEDKVKSDECSKHFQDLFESIGFEITVIPQRFNGDHFIAKLGTGKGGTLCLGHYDTVFPIGTLATMPFKIKGNKAFGPGLLDMKGGLVMGYFAVKALQDLDMLPKDQITFFINGDEESGSFNSSWMIVEEARKNKQVLVLEPGLDKIGQVKIDRYGRGTYDIIAHGRAAHSGSNSSEAISPMLELAHQLIRIQDLNDEEGGVTLAPTYMQAGVYKTCVVPEKGYVSVDVRTKNIELAERFDKIMMSLPVATSGISLEIKGGIDKPPLTGNRKLFEMIKKYGAELGIEVSGEVSKGGSDGNFTAAAGIPTLDGLGMSGMNLHNSEEYINIDHIAKRTTLLARMIQNL